MQRAKLKPSWAGAMTGLAAWLLPMMLLAQATITHGPIVGAVTEQSARMLVRVDTTATVQFQLDTDSTFANPITTAEVTAEPDSDFFAIVDVSGLQPDTKYYYRAVIDSAVQGDIGEFMTFPEPGAAGTYTFAFGACQQAFDDPLSNIGNIFKRIAAEKPRFFLQLGDWTYPDTTDTEQNPTDYFNVDYRRVQLSYHGKYNPNYPMNLLFKVAPLDYVYDDHDYSNDNSDMSYPARENSIRGYKAMFPHYPLANGNHGLWHKFTFGNADFFVLDTRTQRDPNINAYQVRPDGKYVFTPGPDHLILQADPNIDGELQMDWLIRELKASTATWKFVATTVPFNPSFSRSIVELALLFQGIEGLDPVPVEPEPLPAWYISVVFSDMWGGFPHSVQRLVKAVTEAGIDNVIMLSGDSHTAAIDDGANSIFPEIMAGALDRTNSREVALAESFALHKWNRGGQTLERNNFNNHYGRITIFGSDSVRLELVDEFGELITSYTVPAGMVASPVSLTLAPEGQDFGEVVVGKTNVLPIIFINTGADTVRVTKLNSSDPQFAPLFFFGLTLPPGKAETIGFRFSPQQEGSFLAYLSIESNDPQSPFVVPLVGKGVLPTGVADGQSSTPREFALHQNYPNPFNAGTRITYDLIAESRVTLSIYNTRGQLVRQFWFDRQQPGRYHVSWDGRNAHGRHVASGVYTILLDVNDRQGQSLFRQSRKMLLVR